MRLTIGPCAGGAEPGNPAPGVDRWRLAHGASAFRCHLDAYQFRAYGGKASTPRFPPDPPPGRSLVGPVLWPHAGTIKDTISFVRRGYRV